MRQKNALLFLTVVAVSCMSTAAQPPAQKPTFDVASVKPSTARDNLGRILRPPGGRLTANNVTLKLLIQNAYRVKDFQIIGGPNWIGLDRWNIEAKAEEGTIPVQTGPSNPDTPDALSIRLQALLEDRFRLQLHRETRELPTYRLAVAKGGPRMTAVPPPAPRAPGQTPLNGQPLPGGIGVGVNGMVGSAITMAQFTAALSGLLDRLIVDTTGFNEHFDMRLYFAPESAPGNSVGPGGLSATPGAVAVDPQAPSIFTAIQEQLGLKLESSKGPFTCS